MVELDIISNEYDENNPRLADKVAIIGGAKTQMDAPFDDNEYDIWVLGNQLNCYDGKRVDLVFEIHDDLSDQPEGYAEWVVKHAPKMIVGPNFPIQDEKIELFPKDDVNAQLGGENLSSSPAYMIGLAILYGYKEIEIYGVDMCVDNHEYFKQRPNMYAWIGYAKGQGIKVTVAEGSPLFNDTYDEGRDWGTPIVRGEPPFDMASFDEMAKQHRDRVAEIDKKIADLKDNRAAHNGSAQAFEQMARVARALQEGVQIDSLADVTKLNRID